MSKEPVDQVASSRERVQETAPLRLGRQGVVEGRDQRGPV
jgi:hypothetical protein